MQGRWRAAGFLLVLVLAFALVPALALGAPAITQGVQGVVKDATTGAPIPFPEFGVRVDGGEWANMTGEYDGTYSYATPVSVSVEVYADGPSHMGVNALPVAVEAGKVTTVDFTLDRYENYYQPVYRFFNMRGGVHFYTIDTAEFMDVYKNKSSVFKYDGVGYSIPLGPDVPPTVDAGGWTNQNTVPLYRFFNKKTGVHFYTMDVAEMNDVKNNHADRYTYEGVAYNVAGPQTGVPIYRFYNPSRNAHFYTADQGEIFDKLSTYYHFEGIGFYTGFWQYVPQLPDGGAEN